MATDFIGKKEAIVLFERAEQEYLPIIQTRIAYVNKMRETNQPIKDDETIPSITLDKARSFIDDLVMPYYRLLA